MVLKLLAFMVAVAVLGGVAGFSDEQLVNENQINVHGNSSLSEDNLDRQKRAQLTKRACLTLGGTCQKKSKSCDGEMKLGIQYCMDARIYGCCLPPPEIYCDCAIDWKVYRNGAFAEDRCIILFCNNGVWEYVEWNQNCTHCMAYNGCSYIWTYDYHIINGDGDDEYKFPTRDDTCTYALSQYGTSDLPPFGIATTFDYSYNDKYSYITYVAYCELGITVEIYLYPFSSTPVEIYVNSQSFMFTSCTDTVVPIYGGNFGTVFLICDTDMPNSYGIIEIVGSRGLTVRVVYDNIDYYVYSVFSMAMQSLQNELFGLCDVFTNTPPYPHNFTMSSGDVTTYIPKFVDSWEHRWTRSLHKKLHKKPSESHTNQDQHIVERSMKNIIKACKDMNKEPCTVLPSDACRKLTEACVSTTRNLSKHGHRRLQRFIESSSD